MSNEIEDKINFISLNERERVIYNRGHKDGWTQMGILIIIIAVLVAGFLIIANLII